MKKLIIAMAAAAILLVLTTMMLVTGCFGTFNANPPSSSSTLTLSPTPTPIPTPTPPPTLIVPDDFPTISAAIANATNGYLIIVKNGTYNEQTLTINKTLTIESQYRGCAKIILHPPLREIRSQWDTIGPRYEHAIKIYSDNVTLSGFSIKCIDCEDEGMILAERCDGFQILDNEMPSVHLIFSSNSSKIAGNSIRSITFRGNYNTITNNQIFLDLTIVRETQNIIEDNEITGEIVRLGW